MWGLPAVSLAGEESEEDAVRRAGREKLGVELRPLRRSDDEATMTDWAAEIAAGEPAVPQPGPNTQYAELRWGEPAELVPGGARGLALLAGAAPRPRSRLGAVSPRPGLLARGPWRPDQVEAVWRDDAFEVPAEVERRADGAVQGLRDRGSPAHDGMATRLVAWRGGGRRACGWSYSRCAGRCGCSTTPRTASPPCAWCARRTAAGSPAARRLGVQLGEPLGARSGRRGRPGREPGRDAHARASGGVAARARRALGGGAARAARTA